MTRSPPQAYPKSVIGEIEQTGHSLRRQFLSIIAGVVVVSGVVLGLILFSLRDQAIRSGEGLTASFAHVIAEQTNSTLQTIDQHLQLAATRIAPLMAGERDGGAARKLLIEQIRELPPVRALSVADAKGQIVYSSELETPVGTVSDREYFQIYLKEPSTGFHVGPPVRGKVSGAWLISATWPLRLATGELAGVLIAAVDPAYFDHVWREVDVGEGGSIALFRRDGVLLMRSPFDERAMGRSFVDWPMFRELGTKREGSFRDASPIDGAVRMLAYRALSGTPDLLVIVGRSYSRVLAPWRQFAAITVGIWGLAVSVIVVLTFSLERAGREKLRTVASGQEMAQRLTLATEASSIGVWDWDLAADRWYATPTYFAMLGYEADQGIGLRKEWLDNVHPEDRELVAANIQAALAGADVPYRHDARVLHADGSYRWVSVIGRVLERNESGKPSRLLGVMMDITDAKWANEALQRQQAELRVLFDLMPAMIWFKDTENRILRINQRAASAAGLSVDEIEGRPSREIYPRDAERFYADDLRVIQSGQAILGIQEPLVDGDGRELWVQTDKVPYRDQHGKVIGIVVMARDITESKRSAQALESSLREKEGLLKEVHHRVKNNLQVITSLLRLEAGRTREPGTKDVLKEMQGRIRSMALLHETLYQSGKFGGVELSDYLRQLATQLFRAQNSAPGRVQLSLDLSPVTLTIDHAIPCGLIVNELLTNSLKYAFPHDTSGEVRLELHREADARIRLRVSDTGVGLPEDFDSRRRSSLGLQLASDLARQLGGSLEIGPPPKAVFTVTFKGDDEES